MDLDAHDPHRAMSAMRGAGFVVAMSAFRHRAIEYADALLPIAPFTETAGSFISTEGRLQAFSGVVRPLGEARPAWKVLRVLGNLLGAPGFEFASAEEVRAELLRQVDLPAQLSNALAVSRELPTLIPSAGGVQRIADVPIYFADALVRRAHSLQRTADAAVPVASMSGALLVRLGLRQADEVLISADGSGEAVLRVRRDDHVPADCVRIPAAHPLTATLGSMFGEVRLARMPAEDKVRA